MAYANTNHLFTQPVRYYKANDPYFYEVDNIPIRQLEENVLWAKDQLDSLLAPPSGEPQTGAPLFVGDDLDLENVKQLRPRFKGGRTIEVQAGRFMARVNEAFGVADSLAQLTATLNTGDVLPQISENDSTAFFNAIWNSYTSKLSAETFVTCVGESNQALAYRANGLETMYTFYLSRPGGQTISEAALVPYGAPEYSDDGSGRGKTWPFYWHAAIRNIGNTIGRTDFNKINELHVKIVQHWRGVIRTSLVDFRGGTIEVPPFNDLDYFYVEESGGTESVVSLSGLASQRVDLLVVYTHPIDSSGTQILQSDGVGDFVDPVPPQPSQEITQPRLGLIHGAGIGLKRTADNRIELETKRIYNGELKILANLNDHTDGGSNTGIKLRNGSIIHGSFPSPDDLANIAPNLSLELDDNNIQLIGQTALPIAYVVITKDQNNLVQTDIIDIRPFMRTTELAYNERAGVAAAQPPLSLANPAVGGAQLAQVIDTVNAHIESTAVHTHGTGAGGISHVYSDYIMGGLAYGPEGSLLTMNESPGGPWSQTAGGQSPGSKAGFFALTGAAGAVGGAATDKRRNFLKGLWEGQVAKGGSFTISEWIADPNSGLGTKGKYLGLPENRIIPLVPEWQPQITEQTAVNERDAYIGTYQGTGASPYDWIWTMPGTGVSYPAPGVDHNSAGDNMTAPLHPTQSRIYALVKKFRIRMPGGASNFTLNAQYANCFPWDDNVIPDKQIPHNAGIAGLGSPLGVPGMVRGRYAPITVSKSGAYMSADGNLVVDAMVMIPYPIQGIAIPHGSTSDDYDLWGAGYRTMSPNATWTAGWGSPSPGPYIANGRETLSFEGTRNRGTESTPMLKYGICIYPTVHFTVNFHSMTTVNSLTPPTAVGTVAAGVAATTEDPPYFWWTDTRIPPYYDQTIIDLTGGTPTS